MLKKFIYWFIVFGLSFLVSNVFHCEQGKAFFYINLGFSIVCILALALLNGDLATEAFFWVLGTVAALGIILLATWGFTKLFYVDFYVAHQIMTFGMCLCESNNKKND